MYFESISEFLNMGGHGLYVWLAYGIAGLVLIGSVLLPFWRRKAFDRDMVRKIRREEQSS